VAILIPGIMGSTIEVDRKNPALAGSGTRIWFDLPSLALGKFSQIADADAANVFAEDLFERFYGDLADYLAQTHTVMRCPYDWRLPLEQGVQALAAKINQALAENPGQSVSLVAHSLGGLVARTLQREMSEVWRQLVASGGRLVMLGTPNNGAHQTVHALLGKDESVRMLATIDLEHDLQEIVDIVGAFPGALALLPRPGFADSGGETKIASAEYYDAATWQDLKDRNADRWYGDKIGALPASGLLTATQSVWNALLPDNTIADPERVVYVFGQSDKTPCGVQRSADGGLNLLFTADGDGTVTWASGRLDNLDPDARCWLMPVAHGDLANASEYFPALTELVATGSTDKLNRLPRARGAEAGTFVLEAPPPVRASEDELARAFVGGGPVRRAPPRLRATLKVSARAGDLRFIDQPILCGHYVGDPISGAEATLDEMLDGALTEREHLGVYAAEVGTSAIVLRPPRGDAADGEGGLGAVIVGLGRFNGQLGARQVTESVRAAVVRFLLQKREAMHGGSDPEIELYSLLIGWNSTASISVAESVAAITRGVLQANHQFSDALSKSREAPPSTAIVSRLCFIELYRNAAITAAHAVVDLPENLADELKRIGARIDASPTLIAGAGVMDRLNIEGDVGHWSRLIVTDADAVDNEAERGSRRDAAAPATSAGASGSAPTDALPARYYPERLKYVFLAQRARAESVVLQRQPGLIEAIISEQRRNPGYDAKLGHTLFQLMVPLDYKAMAREQSRLLLVLDGYTANLPWELLQAEGDPTVLRMPMVRQMTTLQYRTVVRTANANSALLIVAPSTEGFDRCFAGPMRLADLPAALREGEAVAASLRQAGWNDADIVVSPAGNEALDVLAKLYDRPYRVLMISAHGVFEAPAIDGRSCSGVVLSNGLLLTAVEIELMEVVPEIVFLNCCHLGSVNNPHSEPNKLAYSVSRKLVEMGVRCVVAAGWAVNDDAACTFASAFFDAMMRGETFGEAIFCARKTTFQQHPASNTWGAYQAYGDPAYRLHLSADREAAQKSVRFVAVDELISSINAERVRNLRRKSATTRRARAPGFNEQRQWLLSQLARCPPQWTERPDVLQAIGEFYADCGSEGFSAARQAYQHALAREDASGRVALRAIEQLANIEARQGSELAAGEQYAAALALIDSAARRLQSLADSVRGGGVGDVGETCAERAAMLGSAYKLKAATLARKGEKWATVAATLNEAARAYGSAVYGSPAATPYNTLNALVAAWLAGTLAYTPAQAAAIARQCGDVARERFASSKEFWDAVLSVDALMTAWLLGSPLETGATGAAALAPELFLQQRYEEVVETLPSSARQWDSIVGQWRLLAALIGASGRKNSAAIAATLSALADRFDARAAPAQTPTPAAAPPAPLVHPRRTRAKAPRPRRTRAPKPPA
jgi:CHAT domain-containing protein